MLAVRLIGVLALVALNGFFAATEFSLVAVRLSRVRQLVARGNARARVVEAVKRLYLDRLVLSNRVIHEPVSPRAEELLLTQAIASAMTMPKASFHSIGNKSAAARLLRVDYKTLHLKIKRYEIEAAEFRAS